MTSLAIVRSLGSLAASINAEHDAVERALLTAVEHARRAGDLLIEAKAQVDHGEWLPWIRDYCPNVSPQVAQRYMRIAREWPRVEAANAYRGTHLSVREALALLATPREREGTAPPFWDEDTIAIDDVGTDGGWHYDDGDIPSKSEPRMPKLITSIRRFGQMHPVLVRTAPDGRTVVIDGRKRLAALRAIGATTVRVRHAGTLSDAEAAEMQLAAELGFRTDYAAVAYAVGQLMKAGATPEALSEISPFDAERARFLGESMIHTWQELLAERIRQRDDAEPECPHPRQNPETEYRCPSCAYEWRGQPKPFQLGGRAMDDARQVRDHVRRIVFTCPADQHQALWRQLRQLQAEFGTADHDATIIEAIRRLATEGTEPT
jgi:hypothetical protein